MEALQLQALIRDINGLVNNGMRIKEIEKAIGMPRNCLSSMLKGSRKMPEKWKGKLQSFANWKKTTLI